MINLTLSKQHAIVTPNINKALAVLLEQATPKELELLSEGKDLKSIIDSLLKENTQSSAGDKTLLNLLKNNPTLKELGNVSNTIKELLTLLKSDTTALPIENILKKFLIDIKDLSEPILKQKLENSGIFLESKLKNVENPQVVLKNLLLSLDATISKSELNSVKELQFKIKNLLATPIIEESSNTALLESAKENPKTLKVIAKNVETVVLKLQEYLKFADPMSTKSVNVQLSKLEHLIEPNILTTENFKLPTLQKVVEKLQTQLEQSLKPETKNLLESLHKITASLSQIEQKGTTTQATIDTLQEKKIPQEIRNVMESLKTLIAKEEHATSKTVEPIVSKTISTELSKLEQLITPKALTTESFKLPTLQKVLEQVATHLEQTPKVEVKPLVENLNKITASLKEIEQKSTKPETLINSIQEKKIPQEIKNVITSLKTLIEKDTQVSVKITEAILSKTATLEISKLEQLITPKALTTEFLKLPLLQKAIEQVATHLEQSQKQEFKPLFESLNKISTTLTQIEQKSTTPQTTIDAIVEKKIPEMMKGVIESFKTVINKADPIFSKEIATITNKLLEFTNPEKLSSDAKVKEILSQDFKAVLSQATEEVSQSSHPQKAELLKNIEKLSLQIDYYQLVSHLSNNTSMYVPFSWEQLEDGNVNIQKDKDEKFYCDINLKLQEYGPLHFRLVLYEKNQLNIHVKSNNSQLKDMIKENIGVLRSALIDAQITPREIRFFDLESKNMSSSYEKNYNDISVGFEVKG